MYYERQYNLLYLFESKQSKATANSETRSFWGNFGSSSYSQSAEHGADNLLVYDIPKDIKIWIFQEGELNKNEKLQQILFEQAVDETAKTVVFEGTALWSVLNNHGVERVVSDKLFVVTGDGKKNRIWVSDKWGISKKMIAEFGVDAAWHIDVFNSAIRLFERDEKTGLSIRNFEW